jgi:hypothetical protein
MNWRILGVIGLIMVNLINLGVALLYGIVERYLDIVILLSMLLTSAVLAVTWGLYTRSKSMRPSASQDRSPPAVGNSVQALDHDHKEVTDARQDDDGTIILPFHTADEEGAEVTGYGFVPYSTKTPTGVIRCKRCLLINEAAREGQTCKHCGTYLLLKHESA